MKRHQITISSKFVGNIKRMWDSLFAAYKELIQNALRGGASTIRGNYENELLTVEDDGGGFEDVQTKKCLAKKDIGEKPLLYKCSHIG